MTDGTETLTTPEGSAGDHGRDIRRMFDRIARRYDVMNRVMTFGQDRVWQRAAARRALLPKGGRLLDIGAGTGGIAAAALSADSATTVVAADFSVDMMRAGRRVRPLAEPLLWCGADALHLPFADGTFDAVTSGYLIRNVAGARAAFAEQLRVVRPGGRIVCLDTSPPRQNRWRPLVLFHLTTLIPLMGTVLAGDREAYTYLPASTRAFHSPRRLAGIMRSAGLDPVTWRTFMFGTIAVHTGVRPI